MLQAHSPLWHYLWLAPNILAFVLAVCLWGKPVRRQYPFFISYLFFVGAENLCLYFADLSPAISPYTWWKILWVGAIVEGLLKFAVIAELLKHLLDPWPSIAKAGRNVIRVAGVILVFTAAIAAAFAAPDTAHWLVSGAHVLLQTIYLAQAGLILCIFLFAAYFRIPWNRMAFGIAIGYGFVWSEHLAFWALVAGGVVRNQDWVDFVNMGTFHLCMLVWSYYFLVAKEKVPSTSMILPESNLDVWNRELEHLLRKRSEPLEREVERLL